MEKYTFLEIGKNRIRNETLQDHCGVFLWVYKKPPVWMVLDNENAMVSVRRGKATIHEDAAFLGGFCAQR